MLLFLLPCATVGRQETRGKLDGFGRRPDSAEPSVVLHCLAADQIKRSANRPFGGRQWHTEKG